MDGVLVTALQNFCYDFDSRPCSPDRLVLANIPQLVDSIYSEKPLDPLLVKNAYLQRVAKSAVVTFEACSYNTDEDSLSDVSVTCHGTLREKICIPSPDEFSDG